LQRKPEANFDVTQALAEGQLREGHAQIFLQMGERFCGVVRRVTRDAATKCVQRKKTHQLRENKFADVHWESPRPKSHRVRRQCRCCRRWTVRQRRLKGVSKRASADQLAALLGPEFTFPRVDPCGPGVRIVGIPAHHGGVAVVRQRDGYALAGGPNREGTNRAVVILPTKAVLPSWDSATEVPRTAFPTVSRRIVVHPRSGLSDVSADANGTIIEAECEVPRLRLVYPGRL
jgi:hypothetical protein